MPYAPMGRLSLTECQLAPGKLAFLLALPCNEQDLNTGGMSRRCARAWKPVCKELSGECEEGVGAAHCQAGQPHCRQRHLWRCRQARRCRRWRQIWLRAACHQRLCTGIPGPGRGPSGNSIFHALVGMNNNGYPMHALFFASCWGLTVLGHRPRVPLHTAVSPVCCG